MYTYAQTHNQKKIERKKKRKYFVDALKYCKENEMKIRNDKLAKSLQEKKVNDFWREVRSRRDGATIVSKEIDNQKNPLRIADLFASKFSAVTGRLTDRETGNAVPAWPGHVLGGTTGRKLKLAAVKRAIFMLNTGLGFDGIHSNHFKFASRDLLYVITLFFNACLIHNHIPRRMLQGVINPRVKNKFGDAHDSGTYREIMSSSCFFF